MKKYLLLFLLNLCWMMPNLFSQDWRGSIMAGNKTATLFPFGSAFDGTFHPTFQAATEYHYNTNERRSLFLTAVIHLHRHKTLGTGIGIRFEAGYRFKVYKRFYSEVMLGIGVLTTTPVNQQFKLNENGNYKKDNSQIFNFDAPLTFGFGYKTKSDWNPFIRYQYSAQFPFNRTIPAVPSDNLMLGVNFPIKTAKQ